MYKYNIYKYKFWKHTIFFYTNVLFFDQVIRRIVDVMFLLGGMYLTFYR